MRRFSDIFVNLFGIVMAVLFFGWSYGAREQALDRHCIALEASGRKSFGHGDLILTGWDWPIHWLKGTKADPIPCKPRVSDFHAGGPSGANIPTKDTTASTVLGILQGKDVQTAPGGLTGSLHGSDPSTSATFHSGVYRYLAERSGNQANAQSAGADQGLSPEARGRLLQRLKQDVVDQGFNWEDDRAMNRPEQRQ